MEHRTKIERKRKCSAGERLQHLRSATRSRAYRGLRAARGGRRRTHTEAASWELNFDCRGATILLMKYLGVCFMVVALGLAAQAQTIKRDIPYAGVEDA